jgi:pyroglutamyl-peptidase
MAKTVLVTGFEPFAGASLNPAELVIKELHQRDFPDLALVTAVLPVEFESAAKHLFELIDSHKPDVVLSLGQAEGRASISIERIAINLADARIADNGGTQFINQEIQSGGQAGYFSTLPVIELVQLLKDAGISVSQSLSAGSFVCNYIFYQMQSHLHNSKTQSGFIHLPLVPEQQEEFPNQPIMPLSEMVTVIKLIVEHLAKTT